MTTQTLELGTQNFKEANELIKEALTAADCVSLNNVMAQRYIGCSLAEGKSIDIHGVPGNDMACYMDGGRIEVFGNAQDQVANTMNGGTVIIHGRCGDAAGYAMRGGRMFVRDDSGWRVGIHMKQFDEKCPTIVIGGNAGSFLGEYMAGGIVLLLGEAGEYLATGMHGGVIYLRQKPKDEQIAQGLVLEHTDEADQIIIDELMSSYNEYFADDLGGAVDFDSSNFYKLRPATSRPYADMYAK